MRSRARKGSALLDVVVALVVLAMSGVALLGVTGQTAHTMRTTRDTEWELRAASAELDRFVIYDRTQLTAMIGSFVVRNWTIAVSQTSPDLFDVSIARGTSTVPLLRTTVYRPDSTNANP